MGGLPISFRMFADQLDWLLADPFMSTTPWQWLKHYPRYLNAIAYRLDKARGAGSRDSDSTASLRSLWGRWLEQLPEINGIRKARPKANFAG